METNGMEYVVVGIGINVYEPQEDFQAELNQLLEANSSERSKER